MRANVLGLIGGVVGLVWPDDALAQPSPYGPPGGWQPAQGQPQPPQGQPPYGQPAQLNYGASRPMPPPPVPREETYLMVNPGYLFTKSNGTFPGGHGAEVSLHYAPFAGVFGQAQSFGGTGRFAGGLQATLAFLGSPGFFFGGEVGLAHRGAQSGYASTTSAHLGVFVSAAIFGFGWRWDVPLSHAGAGPAHEVDRAFFLTLKLPLCIFDNRKGEWGFTPFICSGLSGLGAGNMGGRPLEVEREARVAPLRQAGGWG